MLCYFQVLNISTLLPPRQSYKFDSKEKQKAIEIQDDEIDEKEMTTMRQGRGRVLSVAVIASVENTTLLTGSSMKYTRYLKPEKQAIGIPVCNEKTQENP